MDRRRRFGHGTALALAPGAGSSARASPTTAAKAALAATAAFQLPHGDGGIHRRFTDDGGEAEREPSGQYAGDHSTHQQGPHDHVMVSLTAHGGRWNVRLAN